MTYTVKNSEFLGLVMKLLGNGFDNPKQVEIAISHSQGNRLSIITMQVSPTAIVHSLIFFYTLELALFDAISYKNKELFRVERNSESFHAVEKINRYLLAEKMRKRNLFAENEIPEKEKDDGRIESKNQQIEHLKDRLRIEAGKNQSLRNQIKVFKSR